VTEKTKKAIGEVSYNSDILKQRLGHAPGVFVITFGCQQNEADGEKLLGTALSMGYEKVEDPRKAYLILVNTCAIREHAELKALSVIGQYKHIKEENPDLVIGVCGCMTAQRHRTDELKYRYPYVDFSIDPSEISLLPEMISKALSGQKRAFPIGEGNDPFGEGLPISRQSKTNAWLSVMYGCNNFCSYCIVPYVRGREISRKREDIIAEAREIIKNEAKDITLLGQNVNSYKGEIDFPELLTEIAGIEGDFRLRFMTSHPKDASDKLIQAIAENKKIAKHFHLPLQSGSDNILKAMNRHYTIEHYRSLVGKIRKANPDIAITTDIIVGYPGETEKDFEKTLEIIEETRFDMLYSFIFSPRKGTPAAEMVNQIPREVQGERFDRLLKLQENISLEINKKYENNIYRVLTEGKSKTNESVYTGRTDSNKIVNFTADKDCTGEFAQVLIERSQPFALYGKIIK